MDATLTICIDRGGTFTDCFCTAYNPTTNTKRETVFKVLSENPEQYPDAPAECVRLAVNWNRAGMTTTKPPCPRGQALPSSEISQIRIATTVATNALLERKGERVALVTTMGFGDLLAIGNQARPDLFDLKVILPTVLYKSVVEIEERVVIINDDSTSPPTKTITTSSGTRINIISEPSEAHIRQKLAPLLEQGYTSIAILFIHAALFPTHEIKVGRIAQEMGFQHITLSHQSSPQVRALARGQTMCADAYLTPKIQAFVDRFLDGFQKPYPEILYMRSDGGLSKELTGHRAILSGPAGGVVGTSRTAYHPSLAQPVVSFDMGGTSTDVSRFAGSYEHTFESHTAGVTIQAPQLDVHTVAAGGGSLLTFKNGMFHVGPESSGSHPGPICYGRRDGLLSISDANIVLGRLVPEFFPSVFGPGENEPINPLLARRAFEKMIQEHPHELNGMTVEEIALGFVRVANEQMARPIREMTLMRGHDVAKHTLSSFGGAGGQHCVGIARSLGITRVLVHRYAGVLSAVGLALAEVVREKQAPMGPNVILSGHDDDSWRRMTVMMNSMEKQLANEEGAMQMAHYVPHFERFLHVRFAGTDTATAVHVPSSSPATPLQYLTEFKTMHRREFGFELNNDVLVDDIRVRLRLVSRNVAIQDMLLPEVFTTTTTTTSAHPVTMVNCYFESTHKTMVRTPVYDLTKTLSCTLQGPALLLQKGSTVVIEPGCTAKISALGDVELDIGHMTTAATTTTTTTVDPIQLSLFSHRFMSVAEQMGKSLRKTAVSVNIRERLDFSCALFSPDGGLVAHAPYIPVHLGAMSSAVRFQIQHWKDDIHEGDVFVSNHPMAGGSHLPDITVISPAFVNGKIVFWVASRGHHSDIGGIAPGSMPPNSVLLNQEGAAILAMRLVQGGIFNSEGISQLLTTPSGPGSSGTRNLKDNLSDLKAQVAANMNGVELVKALVRDKSLAVVHFYMHAIQESCAKSVTELLKRFAGKRMHAIDYMDDGSPIALALEIDGNGQATFDFTGTGPLMYGNLNCPRAVTLSAIVYCMRCMVNDDVPLNEGCLQPIKVVIPPHSFLDPDPTSAVVGGNVLTSQRLCDVIFKAFDACAASHGCMANLSFGSETFGFYETIGGGAGAGRDWVGTSCVHTHMTNTRLTDVEIMEMRYPVVVKQFARRYGSGGKGRNGGGDGIIREIEFRKPVTASILSERRSRAPFGLHGGGDGALGLNLLWKHHRQLWVSIGAKATFHADVGDRLRILTPGGGAWGQTGML